MYFEAQKIQKNIDELVADLVTKISILEDRLEDAKHNIDKRRDFYSFKVVRQIMKLISEGNDEETALLITACSYERVLGEPGVRFIWKSARRQKYALNLYARNFTVIKMKSAGYCIDDIALTLGVSSTTIRKILKSPCKID